MSKTIVTVLGIAAVLMVAAVFVTANAVDDMSEKSYKAGGCGGGSCAVADGNYGTGSCGGNVGSCEGAGSCGGSCETPGACGNKGCGCGR
ncbi:hypothetical protein GOV07_01765 [Candidatus Woesearchaeota archaeon]|nr:hypothetical protein [Candidatus Woesearchaeota archaeon]